MQVGISEPPAGFALLWRTANGSLSVPNPNLLFVPVWKDKCFKLLCIKEVIYILPSIESKGHNVQNIFSEKYKLCYWLMQNYICSQASLQQRAVP